MRNERCERCNWWGAERPYGHPLGTCRVLQPARGSSDVLRSPHPQEALKSTAIHRGEWFYTQATDFCARYSPAVP